MRNIRKVGLTMAALFALGTIAPATAPAGAQDAQTNINRALKTLSDIAALIDGIVARNKAAAAGEPEQASTMKCPACGMEMTGTKSGPKTRAVKIKGKTYYCCAGCDMSDIIDK